MPTCLHCSHNLSEWTKFLQDIAPLDIIKDLRESEELTARRARYLKDLYTVAQMEEDYRNGVVDGNAQFFWTEHPEDTLSELRRGTASKRPAPSIPRPAKRSRQSSIVPPLKSPRQGAFSSKPASESNKSTAKQTKTLTDKKRLRKKQDKPQDSTSSSSSPYEELLKIYRSTMSPYQNVPAPSNSNKKSRLDSYHQTHGLIATRDELCTTSFSSTDTSLLPSSTTDSSMTDQDIFAFSEPLDYHRQRRNLSLAEGMDGSGYMLPQFPRRMNETVPNSPVMPHPSLLGMSAGYSEMGTQIPPWTMQGIENGYPSFGQASNTNLGTDATNMPTACGAALMWRSGQSGFHFGDVCATTAPPPPPPPPPTLPTYSRAAQRHAAAASFGYDSY